MRDPESLAKEKNLSTVCDVVDIVQNIGGDKYETTRVLN